jgi:GMP synthase-like glutamine amidotransferase
MPDAMKILVFQHIAIEHPGSFRDVAAAAGHTMHAVELDEGEAIPALDGFDILLVMGGPMDVWQEEQHPWLKAEKAAIREWVAAGRPYLGMCLGEQLLGEAAGGEVGPMTAPPEVGLSRVTLSPDPLFAGVPAECLCFQWHGAEVKTLPPGARLLGTSEGCRVQAFGLGRHAYGLQFHMELTETTATEWGGVPEYEAALEQVHGTGALDAVARDVAANLPELRANAARVFSNFLNIAEDILARKPAA